MLAPTSSQPSFVSRRPTYLHAVAERRPTTDVARALCAFAEVVEEGEVPPEELSLRAAQYAECAAGELCPEVAFDPLARSLVSIAQRLVCPRLAAEWQAAVRAMLDGALEGDCQHAAARVMELEARLPIDLAA